MRVNVIHDYKSRYMSLNIITFAMTLLTKATYNKYICQKKVKQHYCCRYIS